MSRQRRRAEHPARGPLVRGAAPGRCALALALLSAVSCERPPTDPAPPTTLALTVTAAPGAARAYDGGHVWIQGPTTTDQSITPGTTVTIENLLPGSYTVSLEGSVAGQVEGFGETSVTVTAGTNSTASVTLQSFVPSLTLSKPSADRVTLTWPALPGAVDYLIYADRDPAFPSAPVGQQAGTSFTMTIDDGAWYFRVRGRTRFGSSGRASETETTALTAWKSVTAGQQFFCALTEAREAYCWGRGITGRLGNGSEQDQGVPVAVQGGHRFDVIAVGMNETCGLSGGVAYCWGWNAVGQLGDGTTTNRATPVQVQTNVRFTTIAPGGAHICGLDSAGVAYCWGSNRHGQLGTGDVADRPFPTPVNTGLRFKAISSGREHTCAIDLSGMAWCWGTNDAIPSDPSYPGKGQLGNGTLIDSNVPVAVAGDLVFATIHADYDSTCGTLQSGRAACWGENSWGQAGDTANLGYRTTPYVVAAAIVEAVDVGGVASCGTDATNRTWCWGAELDGTNIVTLRAPSVFSPAPPLSSVNVGIDTACGLGVDRGIYCWGDGLHGLLGDGRFESSATPVRILDPG